jgi:magnesium chelatase family protein
MLAKVFSCAVIGLEGVIVEVEVDTGKGLPSFIIVGLPDAAVQESREQVQAAIRKEGPAYDMPIAVGALITAGELMAEMVEGSLIVGELSLDGSVRHVRGVLPMAALARAQGYKNIIGQILVGELLLNQVADFTFVWHQHQLDHLNRLGRGGRFSWRRRGGLGCGG